MVMYEVPDGWVEDNNYDPCLYIIKLAIIRATAESPEEKEVAENNYSKHLEDCKHCKLFVDELLKTVDEVEYNASLHAS